MAAGDERNKMFTCTSGKEIRFHQMFQSPCLGPGERGRTLLPRVGCMKRSISLMDRVVDMGDDGAGQIAIHTAKSSRPSPRVLEHRSRSLANVASR